MEAFQKLKVAELKEELKNRGLSTTGNKQALLDRLEESLNNPGEAPAAAELEPAAVEAAAEETGNGAAADLTLAEDDAPTAEEGGAPAEPEVAAADEPADAAAPVTDEERRLARAERFGLVTTEVVQQKKKERAERFGLVTKETVEQKKNERAARFGLITAETEQKKKQDRAARFGLSEAAKKAVSAASGNGKAKGKKGLEAKAPGVDKAKLEERAKRFGVGTVESADFEAKKKARMERFK